MGPLEPVFPVPAAVVVPDPEPVDAVVPVWVCDPVDDVFSVRERVDPSPPNAL